MKCTSKLMSYTCYCRIKMIKAREQSFSLSSVVPVTTPSCNGGAAASSCAGYAEASSYHQSNPYDRCETYDSIGEVEEFGGEDGYLKPAGTGFRRSKFWTAEKRGRGTLFVRLLINLHSTDGACITRNARLSSLDSSSFERWRLITRNARLSSVDSSPSDRWRLNHFSKQWRHANTHYN